MGLRCNADERTDQPVLRQPSWQRRATTLDVDAFGR
jgi:hypothetical protein